MEKKEERYRREGGKGTGDRLRGEERRTNLNFTPLSPCKYALIKIPPAFCQ